MKLTTPADLKISTSSLIEKLTTEIETKFKACTPSLDMRYVLYVKNNYTTEAIDIVIDNYKNAGWKEVDKCYTTDGGIDFIFQG